MAQKADQTKGFNKKDERQYNLKRRSSFNDSIHCFLCGQKNYLFRFLDKQVGTANAFRPTRASSGL